MRYIKSLGYVPYTPTEDIDAAHPFDYLCASRDKENIFLADAKTKARRAKFPDTGIDYKFYKSYTKIAKKHNMRVFLFFVDERLKQVYGNFLDELQKPIKIKFNGYILEYPRKETDFRKVETIYFPMESMITIGELSHADIEELIGLSSVSKNNEDLYNDIDLSDTGTVAQNSFKW